MRLVLTFALGLGIGQGLVLSASGTNTLPHKCARRLVGKKPLSLTQMIKLSRDLVKDAVGGYVVGKYKVCSTEAEFTTKWTETQTRNHPKNKLSTDVALFSPDDRLVFLSPEMSESFTTSERPTLVELYRNVEAVLHQLFHEFYFSYPPFKQAAAGAFVEEYLVTVFTWHILTGVTRLNGESLGRFRPRTYLTQEDMDYFTRGFHHVGIGDDGVAEGFLRAIRQKKTATVAAYLQGFRP